MSALSGPLTTTAYYIDGEPPEGFRESYVAALNKMSFTEIDLNLDHDESMGWVNIADPFDSELTIEKLLWGDYLMVTLRHDLVRLPTTAFKLHLQREIAEKCVELGKDKLSKGERDEVKDFLTKQLRKRVLPTIRTFDVVWNLQRREAWLWSTNKKLRELFVDLFQDTFGLPAHERNPYARLERMDLDDDAMERVLNLEPAAMAAMPRS